MIRKECCKRVLYGSSVIYKNKRYRIIGVNTQDCLLDLVDDKTNHINDVPCEHVTLVEGVRDDKQM